MIDRHHILNTRHHWTSSADALALRTDHTLIPRLDRGAHERLHRNTPAVPLLGHRALMYVNDEYFGDNDPLKSIDNLALAIENTTKHQNTHRVDKELAFLAAYAIQLQKPYIKDGLDRSWT